MVATLQHTTGKGYDTKTERYSHLSELTDDEILLVMFTADVICETINNGREKKLDPRQIFNWKEKQK